MILDANSPMRSKDEMILDLLRCGRYEITEQGEMFDLNWRGQGVRKPVPFRLSRSGYLLTNLSTGGVPRQITVSVHRVVALFFIVAPRSGMQVNHRNGVKTDNRLENLEWCDAFANMRHAAAAGLLNIAHGSKHKNAKLNEAVVAVIKRRLSAGETPNQIVRNPPSGVSVSRAAIRQIADGRAWAGV